MQPLSTQKQRDVSGDVTQELNTWGDSSNTTTFTYDALQRLIGAVETGNTTSSTGYTYNLTGDRLSETGTGDALGSYTYAVGTHRLTGIGSQARAYDAAGNTTGIAKGGTATAMATQQYPEITGMGNIWTYSAGINYSAIQNRVAWSTNVDMGK